MGNVLKGIQKKNIVDFKKIFIKQKVGFILFCLGLFLLPSALSLAGVFLIISLILSTVSNYREYFKDPWNIPFLIGGILIITSVVVNSLSKNIPPQYEINYYLSWIGLANWIPFFWSFWGFKYYLNSPQRRKLCCLILIAGSFPVLISGFGQYFFNWYGPMQTLYGSIIWFQRPIPEREGMTSIFNNANYLGAWLNLIWPFCLTSFINTKRNFHVKLTVIIFIIGTSLSLILTNSRSAWIGMIIGTFLTIGRKKYKLFVFLISSLIFLIGIVIFPIFGELPQVIFSKILPNQIWLEFTDLEISRLDIWNKSISYIIKNPIFGSGAGSFTQLYKIDEGVWKGHSHNLIFELFISYGLPGGLLIFGNVFFMLREALKKVFFPFAYNNEYLFDIAWIISLIVLILSQMVDVQYFDARISMIFWILLSGVRNIINLKKSPKI